MSEENKKAPAEQAGGIAQPTFKRRVERKTSYSVSDKDEDMGVERRFVVHELHEVDPANPLLIGNARYEVDVLIPQQGGVRTVNVNLSDDIKDLEAALTIGIDKAFEAIHQHATRSQLTQGVTS